MFVQHSRIERLRFECAHKAKKLVSSSTPDALTLTSAVEKGMKLSSVAQPAETNNVVGSRGEGHVGEECVRRLSSGVDEAVEVVDGLGCPELAEESVKDGLRQSVRIDESLQVCRELVDCNKQGYLWCDGLLFHGSYDSNGELSKRLILPECKRQRALKTCHESHAHTGVKRYEGPPEQAVYLAWVRHRCTFCEVL